jgi:hypothetical protein
MTTYTKAERCGDGQCPSVHFWSDARCIRRAGHEGRCRSKTYARRDIGTISHTEWASVNGVFDMHLAYKTRFPSNASRTPEATP